MSLCMSCTHQRNDTVLYTTDTVRDTLPNPSVSNYNDKLDTIQRYDSSIYEQVISKPVLNILKEKLPDWRLPDPKSFEALWFNHYKKGESLINYTIGDFNCDSKPDYALILENSGNKQIAAWVLLSHGSTYQSKQLEILRRTEGPISNGLDLVNRGQKLQDMEPQNPVNLNPVINLQCDGIEVHYLEISSKIYYWNKDRFYYLTGTD